jgi:glycosyltransferase involved in cell wall biosynthesis
MAPAKSSEGSRRLVRRELRVVDDGAAPRDACLVLLDRRGGANFEVAAKQAAEGVDISLRVLTVTATDGRDSAEPVGDMRYGAGAWWATVLRDVLDEVEEEIVVFLEISALAAYDGAAALAQELAGVDAAAIAPRVLDMRGITVVFDRGRFSPLAQRGSDYRGFVATSVPLERRPTLYFDGRAFAARRAALLAVGPPDEELEDRLGDVDWSWRLWLAGHRIVTSEVTSVNEREAVTSVPPKGSQRVRAARAAQRLMTEVLEPDNLARALALAGAAVVEIGGDTHALTARRAAIQSTRVISDEQLFAEVGPILRSVPTGMAEVAAVRDLLIARPQRERPVVLILCSDDLGTSMAGPAIRSVELARALSPIAAPLIAAHLVGPAADLPCPAATISSDVLHSLLPEVDAVVLQGPVTDWFTEVLRSDVPIAVDLYDPMHLEVLQGVDAEAEFPYVLNLVIDQLRRGDFFFCASERQRDYWLGMLSSLGRVTTHAYEEDPDLRSLIDVVPFGISAEPPARTGPGPRETVDGIGPDDILLVWNGGLWDWFDTATFLRAIAQVRDELPMLKAYFMGVRRPGSIELAPMAQKVMALSDELGLTGKAVFFNDWTPYDLRQDVYLDATAIVSLHHSHLESRFSFRTRLLDALWGRVPILCTNGDVVAGIVEELQLGLTVPPGDVDAVAQAFRELVADPSLLSRARVHLEAAAPAYEWEHAVTPLARWLARPVRRLDHVGIDGPPPLDARIGRREDLERYANELKMLVPLPVRQHVLGPVKRGMSNVVRAARSVR